MSKRKDRERAEGGILFRNGKYVRKEDLAVASKLAEEEALVKAEKSHGDLVAVNRWLKSKKKSEEQAITADPGPENKPYYCSKCKRTHIGGMKYDNHKEFAVKAAVIEVS